MLVLRITLLPLIQQILHESLYVLDTIFGNMAVNKRQKSQSLLITAHRKYIEKK